MFGLVGGEGEEEGKKSNYKILPKKNNGKTEMSYVNSVCGPMTGFLLFYFLWGCAIMTAHKQPCTCHLTLLPYQNPLTGIQPLFTPTILSLTAPSTLPRSHVLTHDAACSSQSRISGSGGRKHLGEWMTSARSLPPQQTAS